MNPLISRIPLILFILSLVFYPAVLLSQNILPPVLPWQGKSLSLIAGKNDPWITEAERSDFTATADYAATLSWLGRLADSSPNVQIVNIGQTANGRPIVGVIASADGKPGRDALRASRKPLILIQAGIHAGEIDGKDAGMMLLRDIIKGKKQQLLSGVNIFFIPVLNVDGHERTSAYNRVNQRGPANMGWRTNARNQNLNRDYAKLDTEEIRAVVKVMNDYDPSLYLDLHVTDGADYQYDITYGFSEGYSPAIAGWLSNSLSPAIDSHLKSLGHIPGPLIFAANGRDFTRGMAEFSYSTRFSNNYGDIRHVPSILVENHSLKPYRQRVLGTYAFLEAVIMQAAKDADVLRKAIGDDRARRSTEVVLTWKRTEMPEKITFLGIGSQLEKSEVTGKDFVRWTGKPVTQEIDFIRFNVPDKVLKRPKAYWIPATHRDVIARLALHGIEMEKIDSERRVPVTLYRIDDWKFSSTPFEGRVMVRLSANREAPQEETFYPGSVRVSTDQPLGELVMHLLEPASPDSFLQWGFFNGIFSRTEYIEEYAIDPLARIMLKDEKIRAEFEAKRSSDSTFAANPDAIYEWFYSRSLYADARYLLYPVGIEE